MITKMPSWTDLGRKTQTSVLQEALHDLDLDYTVVMKPCAAVDPTDPDKSPIYIPHRMVTIREDQNLPLGIVSDRYGIIQNQDALSFVEDINDLTIVAGGHTSWNSVWMIGELPEVTILGDSIKPHLIFQTSHDGSVPLKATICMLRVICQNQFSYAFEHSPSTVRVHHRGDIETKMRAASEVLQNVESYIKEYDSLATTLASKKLTPARFDKILETFFKIPEEGEGSKRSIIRAEEARDDFMNAYNSDDNGNFIGTRWGIVNAYTDYMTHRTVKNQESVFFDTMESRVLPQMIDMLVA